MNISAGLIGKALAGLAAVAATTTGLAFGDQILGLWQKSEPTKWDNELINYLKTEGKSDWDIEFTVKTGKGTGTDISSSFPAFEDGEHNTEKKKLTITVTTSTANLKGTDNSTKITELRGMNSNKDWSWECKIILSKDKVENDDSDLENKDKLIGDNGFFNKLKKNNDSNKELKIKFIENCAGSRNRSKSAEYEEKTDLKDDNEKITTRRTFDLKKNDKGTNWKIKQREFKEWFSEPTIQ